MNGPHFAFDHAVVTVPDLSGAQREYSTAGFRVRPGGRHEGSPTHNVLCVLPDATYVELLAMTGSPLTRVLQRMPKKLALRMVSRQPPLARRFLGHFLRPHGLADFALVVDTLDQAVAAADARGLAFEGPLEMGRTRHDGARLEWRLAFPDDPVLPFLIEDVTPRGERVPTEATPGGEFDAVVAIRVRSHDRGRCLDSYRALLGEGVAVEVGPASHTIRLGEVGIELVDASATNDPGPATLVLRGARPAAPPTKLAWLEVAPPTQAPRGTTGA